MYKLKSRWVQSGVSHVHSDLGQFHNIAKPVLSDTPPPIAVEEVGCFGQWMVIQVLVHTGVP